MEWKEKKENKTKNHRIFVFLLGKKSLASDNLFG